MSADDRLLSLGAVARELQVSTQTVRNWIRSGKLPAERTLGGWHRVRLSEIRAIQQKAQKDKDPQP